MSGHLPAVPERFLREQAELALDTAAGGVRENTCDAVVGEFAYSLEEEFDVTAHAPIYAPFDGKKHFVALIPANETAFASGTGYVIVDPTVKQFDDALPDVAVLPPSDSRRHDWYDSVQTP